MMRPLAVVLSLLVTGCEVLSGPNETDAIRDLVAARARWNMNGSLDYDVTARALCFCVNGGRDTRVVVRRGVIAGATFVVSGQPVDTNLISSYRTVEQLFDLIDDAAKRKAHRVDVTYDAQLGYPTRFWIDYSAAVADEEFGYEITAFSAR